MASVSSIVERVRAEDIARQGYSRAGYCKLTSMETAILDLQDERARHGWKFRADCQKIDNAPFVWVDTVGGEVFWEGTTGLFVAIGSGEDEYNSLYY